MSRQTATVTFQALELKGSLLPASLLEEVSKFNRPKELLLDPHDYGLNRGERLRGDRIDAAWVLTKELWEEYGNLKERAGASTAGLHFGLRLLREVFGWSGVEPCNGWQQGESRYPITHRAFGGAVPLILRGIDAGDLDRGGAQFGQEGRKRSPHSCLQECLNADDSANWGVLLSGDRLRLLHDNPSLVKPAYLAADLELLIEGERFDEFSVLWLVLHASRFQHPQTGSCVLDDWKQKAEESGERVLGALRSGVQSALESLGSGFLNHPSNGALRDALFKNNTLTRQQFHEQLLRLVYRFLFLFTAEDRDLLFPRGIDKGDPRRRIYREGYSVSRLRELAIKRSAYEGDYRDLWELQRLVFQQLSIGNSPLGLPGLGGLFSLEQCPDLQAAELWNGPLLRAIKAIGWFDAGGTFTRVRYRDLNTEELGSVYEGLLELHPQPEPKGVSWEWRYSGGAGSDRKTTGSYYTPDALVQELIKSALIPVIDDRLSKAVGPAEQEKALLDIKVIDPACGSGHFLLAAARRLAVALAQVRAGDDQPSEDDRQHALRDVVAHCIYAVDKNPMAVELCKVALWIEAIDPGKPLSFLDAHIQCGDSLVGVFDPKVLEEGIPDEAYKPLTGDDKTVCSSLKNENKAARKNNSRRGSNRGIQGSLDLSGAKPRSRSQEALQAIEAMPETTLIESAAKQAAYTNWVEHSGQDPEALAADLFTAAFFLAKTSGSRATVPTTEHLLRLLGGQPVEEAMEEAVVQASQNFRFFHWHLRFSTVLQKGGFDCVLGNPPFGSNVGSFGESVSITEEAEMQYLSSLYASAKNAFDISLVFFEISVRLLDVGGRYGMFTPLGPWSSKGGEAWRAFLVRNARPNSFLVAMDGNWFTGASVQTGALSGEKGSIASEYIDISKTLADNSISRERRSGSVSSTSFFSSVSGDSTTRIPSPTNQTAPLSEEFEVLAGCSTGVAYELIPYIYDDNDCTGRKLVNTKLVDRFRTRWGKVGIKYLKSDYNRPHWPPAEELQLPKSIRSALIRQMRPKGIVAGLTKVLEAFGDYDDEFAGVVQTWIIVCSSNNQRLLRRGIACINSWYTSYQYWRMEGSQSIVGGGMTIKKAALLRLDIPASIVTGLGDGINPILAGYSLDEYIDLSSPFMPEVGWCHIETLTEAIESQASKGDAFLEIEEKLNRLICSAYGLCEEDFSYLKNWHASRDLKDAER